jgi:hypothetical protein
MAAMAAWLSHRGTDPGPLFHPVTQIGQVIPRRMSSQVCRWVLRKRARQTTCPNPAASSTVAACALEPACSTRDASDAGARELLMATSWPARGK